MTSVGIIWTVGDTTYASIRYIAEQIVDFVENHTNLDIPRPNTDSITPEQHHHHHHHSGEVAAPMPARRQEIFLRVA